MKDILISIFKNLYKATDVPYIVTLEKSLERIRIGKSKATCEAIRNGNSKLKHSLPSILFAGEFNERKKSGLKKHSGLMVVDFDKVENVIEYKDELKKNKHFVSLFISPSGNGIKGIIKIPPCTEKEHEQYFKAFNDKFKLKYWDKSGSNVDRVCFESYDPDIYINYKAELFDVKLVDSGFNVKDKVPTLPLTNEDKIISLIMKFNWEKSFIEGQRNAYIFDLSGAFCEYGISENYATSYIINNIVNGSGFSEQEAINTIKSSYKKRGFGIKYFEDYSTIENIKKDLRNGKDEVIDKYRIDKSVFEEISKEIENSTFWDFDKKGNVKINPLLFKQFLERNGFKKYYPNENAKPNLVRVSSNKVKETTNEQIKDFVLNYLMQKNEIDVWNYCASYSNLFSDAFLNMLESIELLMLKDTKDTSYLAFKNGILKVSKDNIEVVDFIDVDGYVWESSIIQRDFKISKDENDFKKFILNISNNEPTAMEVVLGYLLTNYKNKMNNRAIILNDEVISENPEGGTGKGLFVQGLKHIRKVAILDGKEFDDKKSFPYQTVSQDTSILCFDDVKKNFNFESKFSLVTEGMTLERKNKDAIKLPVEDSPKLIISTNYAIKGEGNSHDRRRHELEFSQYYNGKRTPYDEFGKQLFDDWNEKEFNAFDNYMVNCLQLYLKLGLVEQNAKNIKLRKLIAETAFEFFEWIDDVENVSRNNRLDKQQYFDEFIKAFPDFRPWLQRKKFNIWVKKYCTYKGFDYNEGNTNGMRWFELSTNEKESDGLDW